MSREYAVDTAAPPALVWGLVARPDRWSSWAPHIRGAWGLGTPEVLEGSRGAVRLLGLLPVPARITSVEAGRSWTWTVGPLVLDHEVAPRAPASGADGAGGAGSRVTFRLHGPAPVLAAYGPLVHVLLRNLARVASARTPTLER